MKQFIVPTFGENKTANVLLKYNYKVKIDDILAGPVIGIEKTQTTINLGLKKISFLPHEELSISSKRKPNQQLPKNETGDFIILFYDPRTNKTILSLRRLHYLRLWERLRQVDFKNMILFTTLQKQCWGGKFVNFDGLKIFVPNSHLTKYYKRKTLTSKILPLKILEVKDNTHSIIGSSKLAFLKKQSPCLQIGLLHTACVLTIKPFGIFLNIYGLKCLLHISEISNQKIENIKEKFKKGDQIKVKIIYVNSSEGKIAVSAKQN